jgi:DNA-binding MarR family transcriptional regulator
MAMKSGSKTPLNRIQTSTREGASAPNPSSDDYSRAARLREALALFLRASEQITRSHGLTLPRYQLLLMVKTARDGSERASLTELRGRLQLAQSSVVELVQRAEAIGLVRRELSTGGGRGVCVALTPEGERRLAGALSELTRARERLRASLASFAADA